MKAALLKAFQFFLFSSLYISLCSVLMVYQTHWLLLHTTPSKGFIGFVFFSTICSYNFHWFLTPGSVTASERVAWAQRHKGAHLYLYFIGLTGAVICFFTIKEHWLALAFGAFVTFLYSAPKLPMAPFRDLKYIAVGKTLFLACVWTYVTTVLPVFVANQSISKPVLLFTASRFFLIYAICILFDYRDRDNDKREGIKSMVTLFSDKGIHWLFFISLFIFTISTALLDFYDIPPLQIFLIGLPGIILSGLYNYSRKNFSDYFYYFVLDGLMMFSGILMLLTRI